MDWITALQNIRIDRASRTPAPHKAILLLVLIDQIEQGILDPQSIHLSPQLAFQFLAYWEVIAHRGRKIGRVELPFFYLKSDGFLRHVLKPGLESAIKAIRPTSVTALNAVIDRSEMPISLFEFLTKDHNRKAARIVLIQGDWFLPEEKRAFREMFNLSEDQVRISTPPGTTENKFSARQKGREARFRLTIIPLYRYACALCDLKTITPSGLTLVEAAHIHQFAESKNNNPDNGIALCRNHHWAFDTGLWSIDEDWKVIVAHAFLEEISPYPNTLFHLAGKSLNFSWIAENFRPNPRHIRWHRSHRFLG